MLHLLLQTTQPTAIDPTTLSLASIAGIMTITSAVINFIKPYLAKIQKLQSVPVIVYTLAVSLALTLVANLCLHTLPGDVISLAVQTVLYALGAAGIYHFPGSLQTVADTVTLVERNPQIAKIIAPFEKKVGPLILLTLGLSILMSGCQINGKAPDATVQLTVATQTLAASESLLAQAEIAGLIPAAAQPRVKAAVLTARSLVATAQAHQGDTAYDTLAAEAITAIHDVGTYQSLFAPAPTTQKASN